jgi:hypothetical protein
MGFIYLSSSKDALKGRVKLKVETKDHSIFQTLTIQELIR